MSDPVNTAEALPLGAAAPEPLSLRAVLRIGMLRRLWYAQIVSVMGDFLALFAVITVMTFRLHANAQQITGLQIAYMAPIAVLGVISGVFADRWPIRTTLVTSDFTRALLCLLLLVVHSVWGFYLVLAAISVVSSVFAPAQGIALRTAVPLHGLRAANALMQQVMFVMRIIGGPIATAIVAVFGARVCYGIDALSFVASGLLLASLALPRRPAPAAPPASAVVPSEPSGVRRVLRDMRQGASFIFHHAALLFVISAMAAAMFVLGCFGPLIAVYVRDTLHASVRVFGVTSAMIGVGLLAGINGLTALARKAKHSLLVYMGLGGIAVGTSMLAAWPHLVSAIVGLLIIGFGAGAVIVPSQTMIQEETPQAMLGRVGSTVMSLIFTAQIAGLVLSGVLSTHTGVRQVFALSAAMLVVLMIVGRLWMEPEKAPPKKAPQRAV